MEQHASSGAVPDASWEACLLDSSSQDDDLATIATHLTAAVSPKLLAASQTTVTVQWDSVHLVDDHELQLDADDQLQLQCVMTYYLELQEVRRRYLSSQEAKRLCCCIWGAWILLTTCCTAGGAPACTERRAGKTHCRR